MLPDESDKHDARPQSAALPRSTISTAHREVAKNWSRISLTSFQPRTIPQGQIFDPKP